jgi:hypothetical protein
LLFSFFAAALADTPPPPRRHLMFIVRLILFHIITSTIFHYATPRLRFRHYAIAGHYFIFAFAAFHFCPLFSCRRHFISLIFAITLIIIFDAIISLTLFSILIADYFIFAFISMLMIFDAAIAITLSIIAAISLRMLPLMLRVICQRRCHAFAAFAAIFTPCWLILPPDYAYFHFAMTPIFDYFHAMPFLSRHFAFATRQITPLSLMLIFADAAIAAAAMLIIAVFAMPPLLIIADIIIAADDKICCQPLLPLPYYYFHDASLFR